jgi:hypothetical protein
MCASCGCGVPNDNHGDAANITLADLERAAEAAGVSPAQAADNIKACC